VLINTSTSRRYWADAYVTRRTCCHHPDKEKKILQPRTDPVEVRSEAAAIEFERRNGPPAHGRAGQFPDRRYGDRNSRRPRPHWVSRNNGLVSGCEESLATRRPVQIPWITARRLARTFIQRTRVWCASGRSQPVVRSRGQASAPVAVALQQGLPFALRHSKTIRICASLK
jgi:hypothetical protein